MKRTILCIGGGEIRNKETLGIDEYVANMAKERAGERRACGLFIPTASHDFMPYYNSFHKVYTGVFNVKTDVALSVFNPPDMEKLRAKFEKADFIYVGGGDTVFMLESWKQTGILDLVMEYYNKGTPIVGLSAGAIFWFETMYTDSAKSAGGEKYSLYPGLGVLKGKISPHYNQRMIDFDEIVCYNQFRAYGVEDNAALIFENEEFVKAISCGGKAYDIQCSAGKLKKTVL